jgi:sugar/nucleoside kinase (ribokinase family)
LDYLAIGHVTKDVAPSAPGGYVFGGTVTFASLTARNLERQPAVLTCATASPELTAFLRGVELEVVPSDDMTTFDNIYTPSGRIQYIRAFAPPIPASAIPEAWKSAGVVHLGPVDQEVPPELADAFPTGTLVGATPQGWLREWDQSGRVRKVAWANAERALARLDVIVFSPEDMGGDMELVRAYAEVAHLAVVTEDRNGCTVWHGGSQEHFAAFEVDEVDPTGAGDVFAAAFFLRYGETRDVETATRFANCAASFAVQATGAAALPTLDQVEDRLAHGKLRA